MIENRLRARLRAGRPTLGTRILLPDPTVVETIGHTGLFDYVEFLAEYSAFTLHDLDAIARAADAAGLGCIIKLDIEQNRYFAQRAAGAGFSGTLFADLRTVEEVKHAVDSLRPDTPQHGGAYGAVGRRSARPFAGAGPSYIASIEDQVVGLMVEKPEMAEALDRALALGGVDFVQWGPTDFGMSSGRDAASVRAAEDEVLRTCDRWGVPFRAEVDDAAQMAPYLERGVRHFSIGVDLNVLQERISHLGSQARGVLDGLD